MSPADRRALAAMLADAEPQGTLQDGLEGRGDSEAGLPAVRGVEGSRGGENAAHARHNAGGNPWERGCWRWFGRPTPPRMGGAERWRNKR